MSNQDDSNRLNATGWGGRRVGAGAKPLKPSPFPVHDGGKSEEMPLLPPEDLPADQKAFWQTYAPAALEKRTLTPQTIAAFRLLCELESEKRATKATIDHDGRTYVKCWTDSSGQEHEELKAHPLTGAYGRLAKAVEALLARFGLAPFGKPEQPLPRRKEASSNPFAAVAGK